MNSWFCINAFCLLSILLIPLIYLILVCVFFYGIKSLGQWSSLNGEVSTIANMDFKASLSFRKCCKVFQNFYLGYGNSVPLAVVSESGIIQITRKLSWMQWQNKETGFLRKLFITSAALQASLSLFPPPTFLGFALEQVKPLKCQAPSLDVTEHFIFLLS